MFKALERQFARALARQIGGINTQIVTLVSKFDLSNPTDVVTLQSYLMSSQSEVLLHFRDKIVNLLLKYGGKGANLSTGAFEKQMRRIGIDAITGNQALEQLMDQFVTESQTKFEEITAEFYADVREKTVVAFREGKTASTLAKEIAARHGVAKSRASFIARNELTTLYGNVTKARQVDAGVSKYIWRTSEDSRVRESHRELDGKVFSWDQPPLVGHPGEDYMCRCVAIPVIDGGINV